MDIFNYLMLILDSYYKKTNFYMFRIKNLSEDFKNKIFEQIAGKVDKYSLEDFLFKIKTEINRHYFTRTSESNLLRIIQHQIDIAFFINECIKYPHEIEILISIANNSNYLSDILVRNPEYFFWVSTPSVIDKELDKKYYSKTLPELLLRFKSFDAKVNVIKNFKRKEILRIGLKDIYLKQDLNLITKYLSQLAKAITAELFKLCYNQILSKYHIEKTSNRYVLLALGKLGGNELNYSSDIDLIAFYDKNTLIDKRIYYQQILTETILLFIETAGKKTGAGFLYRIDFRLRPDGRNAPLCGSFADYLHYYEMRGESWERQMLIKSGYVCGSKNLYNKFLKEISYFIYPTSFLVSPSIQIKKLKSGIELNNDNETNIKLFSGGIRDIEFSLQTLQLINGGRESEIRTGNSLSAIKLLNQKGLLTESEAKTFTEAYILYRNIEHYMQLMNDQQTHSLPEKGEIPEKLAAYLGYKNLDSLKDQIESLRVNVRNIFNSIVKVENNNSDYSHKDEISFIDQKRSQNNLDFLKTGKSLLNKKSFDNRTISAFENIEEHLYNFLSKSIDPDLVLENFARVIRTANFPKIWYDEFRDKKFFDVFLMLCEHSQKAINFFAEDKILREDFLSRESLKPIYLINQKSLSLKTFLFRASLQLTIGNLSHLEFSELYSNYISNSLVDLIAEFSSEKSWRGDFFIGALGSFGLKQLHFNSDIDLIFIVKNLDQNIDAQNDIQKDFQRLLQIIRQKFSNLEIDCRLRPEGKSSQLVWDLNGYTNYLKNRARVWELQSLTKCRFVAGNRNLYNEFLIIFLNTIKETNKPYIKKEMRDMRKKMLPINDASFDIKKSSGGLLDIEFIIEKILLTNPEVIEKLLGETIQSKINKITRLELSVKELKNLTTHYEFLKNIQITIQNVFDIKSAKIPTDDMKINKLAFVLNFKNSESFHNMLNIAVNNIRKTYLKIFEK